MTLDDLLGLLFPSGHTVERGPSGTVHGTAKVEGQGEVTVIGIAEGTPLGVDGATILAGHILAAVEAGGRAPIVQQAEVNGRMFWRLRTGGFTALADANEFCGRVQAAGSRCWAVVAAPPA